MDRRRFIGASALGAAGFAIRAEARSYQQILGSNERVNFAVIGVNGRAYAHLAALSANKATARLTYAVDVDSRFLEKFGAATTKELGTSPKTERDFRRTLEAKDVDVITIATPDHWHTPMTILGLQAGKHVYVEKPCSHNLHECDLIVQAQRKYGKLVQMGNQQRSSPHTIEIVKKIHEGLIGRAYYARAWYANGRASMGTGKAVPVPATLDWDLWQGPAPRKAYVDNVHPYNWHWLKTYGTGEALNNGTHEVDVCRWALDVNLPQTVTASGGRYQFHDDWQFYDTMVTNFQYADKMISWEGMSCNRMSTYGRDRGSAIHGTTGTVIVDRDGYDVFDLKGKPTGQYRIPSGGQTSTADTIGRDSMTDVHFGNMIDGIRHGVKLDSPIEDASISVKLLLMSNIAIELQRALKLTATGEFVGDPQATAMRRREYAKGWEPVV